MKAKNEFLNDLYVNYYSYVLTYLRSKVSDEQTAEDLTQDVFVKIASNYGDTFGYDADKSDTRTWLFNYVRNTLTDHYRTDKSKRNDYIDSTEDEEGKAKFEFKSTYSETPTEDKETYRAIRRAMRTLNLKEKKIANLFYLQSLKQREIAEHLEIPLGSVNVTVSRIKEKLQTQLALLHC